MGPVSPHWFVAEMLPVKVTPRCKLASLSLTVTLILVHSPHAVVMFCIPDVEVTLMSYRSISNWSKFCGRTQEPVIVTFPVPTDALTVRFRGIVGISANRNKNT